MPCHPARARALLKAGKASVFKRFPFTIIIKEREGGDTQPVEVASRAVSPFKFKAVRKGQIVSARRLWARSRSLHKMAEWGDESLYLRNDGVTFMIKGDLAWEVQAKPDDLITLFRPHLNAWRYN